MKDVKQVICAAMDKRGVTVGALAKKTGIKYNSLYKSLRLDRQIYSTEFVAICLVLELKLTDFTEQDT